MNIYGQITGINYTTKLNKHLDEFCFDIFDINSAPSVCTVYDGEYRFAISKWVSPKRTRSYPYERVYDTLATAKKITVIPIIKDEGAGGDRDFIQWDTISLMSLLDTFVIFAYYSSAEKSDKKNKITKQLFDREYVNAKIREIESYLSSALHWNLKELASANLSQLITKVKSSYNDISNKTGVIMHREAGIDDFAAHLTATASGFINFSREKARAAQEREYETIQPKESLKSLSKAKITITNYLGGEYYFTVDEIDITDDTLFLIEDKHSINSIIPSVSDIKDGLLKMILYSNLCNVSLNKTPISHKAVLRLTSAKLKGTINSYDTEEKIAGFLNANNISTKQQCIIRELIAEANANNFIARIEQSL